jgi:histidyl-tRNA synthetase
MSTIAGGGRYDGLIEELGGRPTPGIGFGMGMERVINNIKRLQVPLPEKNETRVLVAHLGDRAKLEAMRLSSDLRKAGINAVVGPSGRSLRSQMRYASSASATHAVIIGDDELERGVVVLRNLSSSDQTEVHPDRVAESIRGGA